MTLIIYNGANPDQATNLDDGVTAVISRGGWSQRGPVKLPGDLWDDVEETVDVRLITDSNAVYSTLMALARRANEVQSPTHKDHLNPGAWVIVKAKTPDEPEPRWALVKGITVERLDPAHYRASGRLVLEVKFVREGTWRGNEPGTSVGLRTLAALNFWEPVDLSNVVGDAPPDVLFSIRPYGYNNVAICRFESWADEDDEPEFTPYLFAENTVTKDDMVDIASLGGVFSSASQLPGGKCVEIQTTATTTMWEIDVAHYTGRFDVYGLFLRGYSGTVTAQIQHGWENGDLGATGDAVSIPLSNDSPIPDAYLWHHVRLGSVQLPTFGDRIYGDAPALDTFYGTYQIGVQTQASASNAGYLGGLILVPFPDYPPQSSQGFGSLYGNPLTVANGELRRAYWTTAGGQIIGIPGPVPDGPYQSLEPGLHNRVHLIPLPGAITTVAAASRFPVITTLWQVGLDYVPRWQYLNLLPAKPVTIIQSGPESFSTVDTADFVFLADRPGCTFECKLDGGGWGACTSPKSYTGLSAGPHTWQVRATSATDVTGDATIYEWDVYLGGPF